MTQLQGPKLAMEHVSDVPIFQWGFTHGFVGATAEATFLRQSSTALLQSVPAVRIFGSGATNFLPFSMMQGGTVSVHFFRQTLAGALPQRRLRTSVLQQANVEFCPRTLLQVG